MLRASGRILACGLGKAMMLIDSIYFRGHRCFKSGWAGFDTVKPINVIIGRNNAGKSQLLDFVRATCTEKPFRRGWLCKFEGVLDERSLKGQFHEGTSGGELGGYHWENHGRQLVGKRAVFHVDEQMNVVDIELVGAPDALAGPVGKARKDKLGVVGSQAVHGLSGSQFRRLLADRNILPEAETVQLTLDEAGAGATNIIRRYKLSSSFRHDSIQAMVDALNQIFGRDGQFTGIEVKLHDEPEGATPKGHWEVFLGEERKGLIPLSLSGSGLKTVILVLLNLLIRPEIDKRTKDKYVFAFEEVENNLHPTLLRRLFEFLQAHAIRQNAVIFLTTHSSVALDFFGTSEHAQIIHVSNDGASATVKRVDAHFDRVGVVSELGAKPSDLLQANGVVWLEGPSDRIYVNRWIELFADGGLKEGREYQCAFYGGALLAQTQFASPEEAENELVNLLRLNSNIIVVCDGDRTASSGLGSELKARVRRIKDEVGRIQGAHIWVTQAKEIENYLPGQVLSKALSLPDLRNPGEFERFFPSERSEEDSFVQAVLRRKSVDKIDLASLAVPHMSRELVESRFDLRDEVTKVIERIRAWNN
jgi:putative ATP-dependent endonuclease of OLD family